MKKSVAQWQAPSLHRKLEPKDPIARHETLRVVWVVLHMSI